MFTDMVGYSALMQRNEALALELLKEHREILRALFLRFEGTEIETAGDSFFAEFSSAVDAANCAIEIQKVLFERNREVPAEKKILLRIGLHVGDVIHTDRHVHGDGVNLAARLEPLAAPGCICISEDAARQIGNKIEFPVVNLGKQKLKNFNDPVNVYSIQLPWENKNIVSRGKKAAPASGNFKFYLVIGSVILFLAAVFFIWQSGKNNLSINPSNRIAVLPFINISQESSNEYFAEGITEEIISNLAKISGLDVIARTSIMKYKNSNLSVSQIADELRVGTILEGSVRKAENKARITVQLVDASSQKHLWSEDYDRELKDIFAIQSDIAMKVAEELKVQLLANEREQIGKRGTENMDAFRNYLLGNYFLNKRTGEDLTKSAEYYSKAVEYDPRYAAAYAGLANCYTLLGGASYGSFTKEDAELKAKESVAKALEIDETLADAHASNAYIKFRFDWNWDEAEKEFIKAIELKPGYAQAHEWYSLFLALIRRSDKALDEMQRAYELDPLSPSISTGLGRMFHLFGKNKPAVLQFKKTIEMYPDYAEGHFGLGMSFIVMKNYNEALNELNKAIELSHSRPVIVAVRGMLYAEMGRRKDALAAIDEVIKLSEPNNVSPIILSNIYLGLGDLDKVFELFYQGYETRDPLMVYVPSEPFYDVYKIIYSDKRYHDILKKMKLEKN